MIDPAILASAMALVGATGAMIWSYLMASKVAAPRAKRLIVDALTTEGEELKAVRTALIDPALAASRDEIAREVAVMKQTLADLPRIDPEDLSLDYDEMGEGLRPIIGPMVSEHVTMAVNQFKAQETKALQDALNAAGLDEAVEGMGAEAQQAMLQQMNLGQQAAMKIMSMKPSKKWEKDHPFGVVGFETFKAAQMQVLSALQGGNAGNATIENAPSRSAPFTPGSV